MSGRGLSELTCKTEIKELSVSQKFGVWMVRRSNGLMISQRTNRNRNSSNGNEETGEEVSEETDGE